LLNSEKFSQIEEKVINIPEKEIQATDEPKIGVLVCHCGINIGKYINVSDVVEYVKKIPNVVICEANLYSCSSDSQTRIKEMIEDYDLNRFIVASCTPRTHEMLFQETCQEAGLNKYLFEMVNIRDQCSWVHMTEKEAATDKVKDLIRMAVAKSRLLKPQREEKLSIIPTALIIGGGVSGMTAALNIANQGFKAYLVEKESILGGNLNDINTIYPLREEASRFLDDLIHNVENNKNIYTYLNSKITKVNGFIGNYDITIVESRVNEINLKIGTIIVATGARELKPSKFFQDIRKDDKMLTQLELEQKLKKKDYSWLRIINRVTIILCVNSRQKEEISYCSNVCCAVCIKNVDVLKKIKPNLEIIILYRDFQMAKKEFEEYYREHRKDAIFLRYNMDNLPKINRKNNNYAIKVYDTNLQESIEFQTDLIILSTPMIAPEDINDLAKLLKVPLDNNGFFLEAHVKLRPLDFATDGIFLAGCAQWPKSIQDSISQANGAAGRASRFLSAKEVKTSGLISEVKLEKCIGCGKCMEICPYNAVELIDFRKEFEEVTIIVQKAYINPALCKGCGTCAASCPVRAISVKHYDLDQISAMIESYLLEKV